jgi:hypothetical protein
MDGSGWDRRDILKAAAAAGVGSAVFTRALSALAAEAGPGAVTPAMVAQAEWVAGVSLTDAQRELMLKDLAGLRKDAAALQAIPLDNAVAPALVFRPDALSPSHAPVARSAPRSDSTAGRRAGRPARPTSRSCRSRASRRCSRRASCRRSS